MRVSLFITLIITVTYPHFSLVGTLVSRYMMGTINFFNHCFPMDKYDTLEYSPMKATMVFVRLWIYLCTFKNTSKLFGTVAGETISVKILILA